MSKSSEIKDTTVCEKLHRKSCRRFTCSGNRTCFLTDRSDSIVLQARRKLVNTSVGSAIAAKEFLETTSWLSSRSEKEPVSNEDMHRLAEALTSTLVGLRIDTPSSLDVSCQFIRGSAFLVSTGFPNFIRDLLKSLYPTLRHCLFRNYQTPAGETIFVWGETRDRSSFVPRLTVSRIYHDVNFGYMPSRMVFIRVQANAAWIRDRENDHRFDVDWILAILMSTHPRLGRNSWLFRLDKELIATIAKPFRRAFVALNEPSPSPNACKTVAFSQMNFSCSI